MDRNEWRQRVSTDEAVVRAIGRNRINRWRKLNAEMQMLLAASIVDLEGRSRGIQSRIAKHLGVDRGTVSRYFAKLRKLGWTERDRWAHQERIGRAIDAMRWSPGFRWPGQRPS